MNPTDMYGQVLESVENARKAIEEAQGNNNPTEFQQAKQLLATAHTLVHRSQRTDGWDEEQTHQLMHAFEHLRHLQETADALEATRYF